MPVNKDTVSDWMTRFAASMQEHREELVRLDTAIGDGDHGTNMDRGMRKALEKLDSSEPADPGAVLKTAAMAAERGMRDTIPLVARKGRASYLGERSQDHQDPGATSTYYLCQTAAEALSG